MTENFDEGRIIIQKKIEIKKNDNKSSIIYKMLPIYDEFTKYIIKNYYKILKVKV